MRTARLAAAVLCLACAPRERQSFPDRLDLRERSLRDDLAASVRKLSMEIGERNVAHPESYARAADWIAAQLRAAGLAVHEETYAVPGRNIVAEIRGTSDEIVVIGAHYDSVAGTPGADDNASGVAALLALARHFAHDKPARTLRFVAFANEEPPYFQTEQMGSLVYARGCEARHEKIAAMLSLETMAFFSDAEDSQRYPFPLSLFYPSRGDFLGFVGNLSSNALVSESVRAFRGEVRMRAESASAPELLPGVGWSDHWSFWQIGVPAVMVTDTAPFRDPNYHLVSDTPDKLDYSRFASAVVGVAAVIRRLSRA
jgi:Zn-dependent M28 family amino/carboxypeptidase